MFKIHRGFQSLTRSSLTYFWKKLSYEDLLSCTQCSVCIPDSFSHFVISGPSNKMHI